MWQFIIANLITMAIYKNPGARDDQQDLINQPTDCCQFTDNFESLHSNISVKMASLVRSLRVAL